MNIHNPAPAPDRKTAVDVVSRQRAWRYTVPSAASRTLAPVLFAIIAGIDGLGTSIAFAALIFAGPLAAGFSMGVGVILLSSIVMALWIGLRSRYPSSIGQVQEASIAILATAIATATLHLEFAPEEVKVATAFAILGSSAVVTGAVFWLFGLGRFGRLVRFMPYPVVAGFLAGSGWLLIQGAVMMIIGDRNLVDLLVRPEGQQAVANLYVAVVFSIVMVFAIRRSTSPLTMPLILLGGGLIFYGMLAVIGVESEQARAMQWLPAMPAGPGFALAQPVHVVTSADWSVVLQALPAIISVALLGMVGLLLNTSGLEVATRQEIDADAELRTTGIANIVAGGFGGAPGFTGLSMTLLANRMGAKARSVGIATALMLALMLPFAGELAGAMPTFVAAGLMIALGIELIQDWLWRTRTQLPRMEWLVVLAIPLGMAAFGFMGGMALGLALSIATFVYNYARLSVIRVNASLRERKSSIDRPPAENSLIELEGEQVQVLELQEFLFFGTAEQIIEAIRCRQQDRSRLSLRFVVIDFRRVSGMDAAAAATFVKIRNLLAGSEVELVFSSLSPEIEQALARNGIDFVSDPCVGRERDLDHALERCEERLIAAISREETWQDIEDYFAQTIGPSARLKDLVASMEEIRLQPGDRFIRAGEAGEDLFLLWTGRAKVEAVLANGKRLRLRTVKPGVVLGEIAIYRGGPRTADVVAEVPSTAYRLARRQLRYLEQADPELALLVHRLCATTLAERLTIANRVVQSLHE
ncbi:cyclic nucleotide-binding protein [Agrobacterium albertimagni AOL15]|uniref:Cyclic nucleotide-binding protein n=1 Tax=Agrobacterium albertimagni AOL15 TaxID=1156935 RepID=K2PXX4_9HYPH|nr:SulP family inorganic anion transporter [Agrobacterium albertimagni]EKF57605.1 cyclic nucleotide-binding protein [Agrobacterium albertimagni AOL15]